MSHFDRALAILDDIEGGFSNRKNDRGGRTDRGVSERAHPEAWADGKITDEEFRRIYRSEYWDAVRGDDLPWPLSLAVFDFAVNSGAARASRMLQLLVGGVFPDGKIGPATLAAVSGSQWTPLELTLLMLVRRRGFLLDLVALDPTQEEHRKGWLNRLARIASEAIRTA